MQSIDPRIKYQSQSDWPHAESYLGIVDLHMLPPAETINGARIRELTGDKTFPDVEELILWAFRAVAGGRQFHVGFCIGNEEGFSPIGIGVIERLMMESPEKELHVVRVSHEDIAWDIVLRQLRSFTGKVILFAFPDSDVYDAGTSEIYYSCYIRNFGPDGKQFARGTSEQRRKIRLQKAEILNRPPPPTLYAAAGVEQEDSPWIFRVVTPTGKAVRAAVWNGRRNYEHTCHDDILRWVGGDKIAIVQVHSPVGVNLRSSV